MQKKGLKVLSIFDGISCARVALERTGISVERYFASEIDKYAIQISEKNYNDIIHIGDVRYVAHKDAPIHYKLNDIDLLIGGSPCQDLSIAKKDRKGLDGERSGLFWEYVRILKQVKPKYFILENVNSMPKEAKELITKTLGVEPIMINASLVSAQNRKRLFWTNIPNVTQPEDRNIKLSDIIETNVDECFQYRRTYWRKNKSGKIPTLTSNMGTGGNNVPYVFDVYNQKIVPNNKAKTLGTNPQCATAVAGQLLHVVALTETRTEEAKRIRSEHYKKTGKDWSPRFEKELVPRQDEKANTITTGNTKESLILENMTIRKLTPIECERLQGLPDNYTAGISNTQRYKCLGNAFNVDVVVHILSFITKTPA